MLTVQNIPSPLLIKLDTEFVLCYELILTDHSMYRLSLFKQNFKSIFILLIGLGIVVELITLAVDFSIIPNPLVGSSSDTLKIKFTGETHNWQFLYPGKDGIFNTSDDISVLDSDNLLVPKNKEIFIEMRSKDYIYCLDIPELQKSQIAVPNMEFNFQFFVDEPETLSLLPGAICGRINEQLERKIIVVSNDEFDNWYDYKK